MGIESNVIGAIWCCWGCEGKCVVQARHFHFQLRRDAIGFLDEFRKLYGPTMNAFEAAEKNGRAADLQKELEVHIQQPK
jgi:hypothetical protein